MGVAICNLYYSAAFLKNEDKNKKWDVIEFLKTEEDMRPLKNAPLVSFRQGFPAGMTRGINVGRIPRMRRLPELIRDRVNVGRIPRMRRFTDCSGNNPYT